MNMRRLLFALAALGVLCTCGAAHAGIVPGDLSWTVAYSVATAAPADNRGIAVDPTGQYLYLGYNNIGVNKVSLATGNVMASLPTMRGKSIAVDDMGRVYTTGEGGESIFVYDADLGLQYEISNPTRTEGIALRREGGVLALYTTERGNGKTLTRYELTESGGAITGHTAAGLDGDGVISIGTDVRGVGLAADGSIWVADPQGSTTSGKVYKYSSTGSLLGSVTMTNPYYFAFCGDQVLVTQAYGQRVDVLNASDLSLATSLAPPWESLNLPVPPEGYQSPATSGIAMAPDGSGFYLTYEHGSSAAGVDSSFHEPVLFAKLPSTDVPEPMSIMLGIMGLGSIAGVRRLRKR